ncbi:hypothetical protein M8C82_01855 [Agrobacterium pusense]|nr:hypothetical protein [Agrobacterium pusense]WKD44372.1 hypothetical protein M8C82_01855 [Agrobacterium pusense]
MRYFVISLLLIVLYALSPLLTAFFVEGVAQASGCKSDIRYGVTCPSGTSVVQPFDANLLGNLYSYARYFAVTILSGALFFSVWLVALLGYAIASSKRHW